MQEQVIQSHIEVAGYFGKHVHTGLGMIPFVIAQGGAREPQVNGGLLLRNFFDFPQVSQVVTQHDSGFFDKGRDNFSTTYARLQSGKEIGILKAFKIRRSSQAIRHPLVSTRILPIFIIH
jgi:hypothetical protein